MKEQYKPVEMETIQFRTEDVIRTSQDENELPED